MKLKKYSKNILSKSMAILLAMTMAIPATIGNVSVTLADDTVADETLTEDVFTGMYGDVNESGEVNAEDALAVLKHAAKLELLDDTKHKAADVNVDKAIDASDALEILKYAAKLIDKFPAEEADDVPTETPAETTPAETTPVETTPAGTTPAETDPVETATPGPVETATPEPVETATPEPAETTPEITAIPTDPPTPTPTPRPTQPPVEEVDPVAGIPVEVKELNGATLYTGREIAAQNDIINFNTGTRYGVEIINPILNNEKMIDNYADVRDMTEEGKTNVFDLTGSKLGWNNDENKLPIPASQLLGNPDRTADARTKFEMSNHVLYPAPRNRQGFSMSYWAKTPKEQDQSAAIVFANANEAVAIAINGTAKYNDVTDNFNFFDARQHDFADGEWHYYTITFANDWIGVYIDGYEAVYEQIELSRKKMKTFNDGFLTRRNACVTWTEEDYANDWQCYIQNQRGSHKDYESITNDNYTLFGLGRYSGQGASGKLLLTFMAGETTKVYLGGAATNAAAGSTKYAFLQDTKMAQPMYYLDELTPAQILANYKAATKPDDSYILATTPAPTAVPTEIPESEKLDGYTISVLDQHASVSYDEATNVYTFDGLNDEDGGYYGVQMNNPFNGNKALVQTIEEALDGQELFPTSVTPDPADPETQRTVVAGDAVALQYWRGNYDSEYYYGDITKLGNFMTDEEKNPETATQKTKFHRPVWTKGASVGFWMKPTKKLVSSGNPILSMGMQDEFYFTLAADGSVMYFDAHAKSFDGGQISFKDEANNRNGFVAAGDASMVNYDNWNYYLVTFANDWIQVYINGREVIYSRAGIDRKYTKDFNAGFLTRYNNVGLVMDEPDTDRRYISKANGISNPTMIATDPEYGGNDNTAIRANGVYANGYNKESAADQYGVQRRLLMDNLICEGANFYIGGFASFLTKAKNWSYNALGRVFHTEHLISDGSAFTDVRFYTSEITAEEAKEVYQRRLPNMPGYDGTDPNDPNNTPDPNNPNVTPEPGQEIDPDVDPKTPLKATFVNLHDGATVENGVYTFYDPLGYPNGVEFANPLAGLTNDGTGGTYTFWFTPAVDYDGSATQNIGLFTMVSDVQYELLKFDCEGTRQYRNEDGVKVIGNYWNSPVKLTKGQEYFVTICINDEGIDIYFDGVKVEGSKLSKEGGMAFLTYAKDMIYKESTRLFIGGTDQLASKYVNVTMNKFAEGTKFRNVIAYRGAMTDEEIKALYEKALVEDPAPVTSEEPIIEYEALNDAAVADGDKLTFNEPLASGLGVKAVNPFSGKELTGATISYFLNPGANSLNQYNSVPVLVFSDEKTSGKANYIKFDMSGTSQFQQDTVSKYNWWHCAAGQPAAGTEIFVTVVIGDENTVKYYVNGELCVANAKGDANQAVLGEDIIAEIMTLLSGADTELYIAGYDSTVLTAKGENYYVKNINFPKDTTVRAIKSYDNAMTADEVKALYEATK